MKIEEYIVGPFPLAVAPTVIDYLTVGIPPIGMVIFFMQGLIEWREVYLLLPSMVDCMVFFIKWRLIPLLFFYGFILEEYHAIYPYILFLQTELK